MVKIVWQKKSRLREEKLLESSEGSSTLSLDIIIIRYL